MSSPTQDQLLTISQAATRLGVTYRHVRRLVALNKLAAENVGSTKRGPAWRVSAAAVSSLVRHRGQP